MDDLISTAENQESINQVQVTENKTKLWNPKFFIVISALFSFLPAAILYSLNYGRLGNGKKRNMLLIAYIFLFIIVISLSFLIQNSIMKALFYGLNIGLGVYMQIDQTKLYIKHIQEGGKKASYIIPVIICTCITGFVIWGMFSSVNVPDQMKKFSGDEMYYTDNVTINEVNKLGNFLEENDFFINDGKTVSVKLDKKSDTYIFSMILNKKYIDDKEYMDNLKQFAQQLSTDLFKSKVEIDICDNTFKPIKVVDS
jgi:hypothetical protein